VYVRGVDTVCTYVEWILCVRTWSGYCVYVRGVDTGGRYMCARVCEALVHMYVCVYVYMHTCTIDENTSRTCISQKELYSNHA
jgi:hypothetical protein